MYKAVQKRVMKKAMLYAKQAMLADFMKQRSDTERFNCIFKIEDLDEEELKQELELYKKPEKVVWNDISLGETIKDAYFYQGNKIDYQELKNIIKEEYKNISLFIQEV